MSRVKKMSKCPTSDHTGLFKLNKHGKKGVNIGTPSHYTPLYLDLPMVVVGYSLEAGIKH